MSMELIMTEAGAIDHGPTSPISGGEFSITSVPSTKAKARGDGVYTTPLAFTFIKGSAIGFVSESISGAGTIPATAAKVKAEGALVMRARDTGTLSASGSLTGGGTGTISGPVEVTEAGQTKVRGQ